MTLKVVRGGSDAPRDKDIPRVNTPQQPPTAVQTANEQVKSAAGVSQRLSAEAVVVTGRSKVDSSEKIRDTKEAKYLAEKVSSEIRKEGGEAKGAHSGLTSASGRSYVD